MGVVSMPSKPIKRGLKLIALVCADWGVVLNAFTHNKPMQNLEKAQNRRTVAWMFDLLKSRGIAGGLSFLGQNYEVCVHFLQSVHFHLSLDTVSVWCLSHN